MTLYIAVISFLTVIFQYINVLLPDVLDHSTRQIYDLIRGASSALIVAFPIYVWISSIIAKDAAKHPRKRELGIRKWLVYLTLLVAAITMIIYLIQLVNGFYGGGLSLAFGMKVLAVLLVTGGVFGYYLWDVREANIQFSVIRRIAWGSGIVVLATIVSGFFIAGSPTHQRELRLDDQRVADLEEIQSQVVYYWQQKDVLPRTLTLLSDPIAGFAMPTDPQTEQLYDYQVTGDLSFELCANFAAASVSDGGSISPSEDVTYDPSSGRPVAQLQGNWQHDAGKACFTRTIDPALYAQTQ